MMKPSELHRCRVAIVYGLMDVAREMEAKDFLTTLYDWLVKRGAGVIRIPNECRWAKDRVSGVLQDLVTTHSEREVILRDFIDFVE